MADARLRQAPAILPVLAPVVPYLTDDPALASRTRDSTDPWRAWYKTARWQRLRLSVLVASDFTCVRCKTVADSPGLVADHIKPHRGNAAMFWNRQNLQCLCTHCHSSLKQREERGGG